MRATLTDARPEISRSHRDDCETQKAKAEKERRGKKEMKIIELGSFHLRGKGREKGLMSS